MEENGFERWRKKWYDKKEEEEWSTEVLFIGESPPNYSSLENYFYYTGDDADQRNLFGSLLTPLGIENDNNKDKEDRLKEFLKKYWLIDLFPKPLDCIRNKDIKNRNEGLKELEEKIRPQKIAMFLPKKTFKHNAMEKFCEEIEIKNKIYDNEVTHREKQNKLLSAIFDNNDTKVFPFPTNGVKLEGKTFNDQATENTKNKKWLKIENGE